MDSPAFTGNAILNAAAVWFILKAIEVTAFVVYDTYSAFAKWIRNRRNPDPPPHENKFERRRGWMEYVWSGVGFLNLGLCRQRRMLLLLVSTIIPLAVFILELLSITLGNEHTTCVTSRDPNIIRSPSLALFGEGRRHVNLSTVIDQIRFGGPLDVIRPCVSWSSTHFGVDFVSRLCSNTIQIISSQRLISERHFLTDRPTGLSHEHPGLGFMEHDQSYGFIAYAFPSNAEEDRFEIGLLTFSSEVVVNGKHLLYKKVTSAPVSKENMDQLIQDYLRFEHNGTRAKITTDTDAGRVSFAFIWNNFEHYLKGVRLLEIAVLAQTTREPIQTAAQMSTLNAAEVLPSVVEISCEQDFRLPRTASIIIIVVAVVFRFILIFIPTSILSVEYALEISKTIRSRAK